MSNVQYIHSAEVHNTKAAEHFIPFLLKHIQPQSVIDIGCGTGTWLKVFKNFGVKKTIGVDGDNVDQSSLEIPTEEFIVHDLRKPLKLNERFDLAVCLEVAEHLPAEVADNLVLLLIHCSDTILFSAALPEQGGQNHINEQSFSYWIKKFNDNGYIFRDVLRPEIWNVPEIDWWYRQNSFLVVKGDVTTQSPILDYVHPQSILDLKFFLNALQKKARELEEYKKGNISFKQLVRILFIKLKRRLTVKN